MPTFAPYTWNAERRRNADGTKTTRFHGRWNNTLDANDQWKPIDLSWQSSAQDFRPTLSPFGLVAPRRLRSGILLEDRKPFDAASRRVRKDREIGILKTFTGVADVEGTVTQDGILYPGAYPFGDVLIQTNQQEIRTLVVFPSEPAGTGDIEIPFTMELPAGLSVLLREGAAYRQRSLSAERDVSSGLQLAQDAHRNLFLREVAVWDSAGNYVPITLRGSLSGNLFTGRKIITRDVLSRLVYPAFADTTTAIGAGTNDGQVSYGNATWATCRSAATGDGVASAETSSVLGAFFIGGTTYACFRLFFPFTTSISASDTVSAIDLTLNFPNTAAAQAHSYYVAPGTQADTLTTADYDSLGSSGIGTGSLYSAAVSRSAGEAAGDKTFSLNAAAIAAFNNTGTNKYAVVDLNDWDNIAPTTLTDSGNGNRATMADSASNDPTITVTHAPPPSSGALLLLGAG